MNVKRHIAVLLLAPAAVLTASAASDDHEWTLDECIDYAVEHNISLRQQAQQVESGRIDLTAAKNSLLPQVGASAAESFNFGRGLTAENIYANRNTTNFQWGVQVSVPIFSGLRNLRTIEQSKLNLYMLACQLDQARDNVTVAIIAQYLQVNYADAVVMTSARQVELAEYELSRRMELALQGKIAEVEVLEAESQLAQDNLTLVNARNDYRTALLELAQLLQLDTADNLRIASSPDSDMPALPAFDQVYAAALGVNNSLRAANASVDVAQSGISVARTGYIPTLSFNGGVGSSYYNIHGLENMKFGRQMRENYSTYLGFSLNIPIFDAFTTRNAVRRASVQLNTARLQVDQVRSDLYKAIQQAHLQATGAHEKLLAARTAQNSAEAAFQAMTEKYNLGRASATEYEQSRTAMYKASIATVEAKYEYLLRHRILIFYETSH